MLTLTRRFTFEMAHALNGYDGACRHIHGHSYKLYVTIEGTPSLDPSSPKLGMVIDFSVLKKIVNTAVVDKYDHALMLKSGTIAEGLLSQMKGEWSNIVEVDFQPTCENLVVLIFNEISAQLPEGVKLHELKLYETENSYVTYRP